MSFPTPALNAIDLGRLAYAPALERQRQIHEQVLAGGPPTLLLVEHDPVITVSQRKSAGAHLLASPDTLAKLGIDTQPTDRGGDITYHGPGQLVAYPILRMADYGLNVGRYMRLLEQVVIDTVAEFGVAASRHPAGAGVWIDPSGFQSEISSPSKLAALGVRVKRNVTLHGLALNVSTDLSHFDTIVPCGLAGHGVTSLRELLGPDTPDMAQVKETLSQVFQLRLSHLHPGREFFPAPAPGTRS